MQSLIKTIITGGYKKLFYCNCRVFSSLVVQKCKMTRNLAAFDFDQTIINANSDTAICRSLLPAEAIPAYQNDGWTSYMQSLFNLLYCNKINQTQITNSLKTIEAINGMTQLIQELSQKYNYDIIIISDSNTYFINTWLHQNNLSKYITKVFTNPAEFQDGLLKIEMFHVQTGCELCAKNLCKGQILNDFINGQKVKGVTYNKRLYCGDGSNDFCPMLTLRDNDLACCRKGYKITKLILDAINRKKYKEQCHVVRAKVIVWTNGVDILNAIKENY